jgi:hypothetical protein
MRIKFHLFKLLTIFASAVLSTIFAGNSFLLAENIDHGCSEKVGKELDSGTISKIVKRYVTWTDMLALELKPFLSSQSKAEKVAALSILGNYENLEHKYTDPKLVDKILRDFVDKILRDFVDREYANIVRDLESDDSYTKCYASFASGYFARVTTSNERKTITDRLLKILKEDDKNNSSISSFALSMYKAHPEEVIPIIIKLANNTNEMLRKAYFACDLARYGTLEAEDGALPLIATILSNPDTQGQEAIIACISTSGSKRLFTLMLPALKRFLNDKNLKDLQPNFKIAIPHILHPIGSPEALELLKKFRQL